MALNTAMQNLQDNLIHKANEIFNTITSESTPRDIKISIERFTQLLVEIDSIDRAVMNRDSRKFIISYIEQCSSYLESLLEDSNKVLQ